MSKILRIGLYLELLVILAVFSLFTGVLLANKYPRTVVETRYFPAIEKAHPSLPNDAGGMLYRGDEYDTIMCREENSCLHEVGHIVFLEGIDADQWKIDIETFLEADNACEFIVFPGMCGNPLEIINGQPWGGPIEFYASLYAEYHAFYYPATIPDELLKYFGG